MFALLSAALWLFTSVAAPQQASSKPAVRETVEKTIADAIQVLEAKDYRRFLTDFILPKNLAAVAGTPEAFEQLVKEFPGRSGQFMFALKEARTGVPIYNAARNTATFPGPSGSSHEPGLMLTKVDRTWYIANK